MSLKCTFHFLLLNTRKMNNLMFFRKLTPFPLLEFLFFKTNQVDWMGLFDYKTCIFDYVQPIKKKLENVNVN
jgi:hypothetical protein